MIDKKRAIKYCKNDISLIENYDKAVADKSQVWHCHHRRESIYSAKELIDIGEYYNRPACELIFLTPNEHHRLHHLGKYPNEESRNKMSEAKKGKNNPRFGKPAWNNGKHQSAEIRKKMSESKKGNHWYNNGVKNIQAKTCPKGFVKGRMRRKERAAAKQTNEENKQKASALS